MRNVLKKLLFLNAVGIIGTKVIAVAASVLAASLITYGGYSLWDTVYTSEAAFSNNDLSQYKPTLSTKSNEPASLEELEKINKDTVAWLTIYDTNIDYPVVQGKDDLEYAGKDVYGNASLTGSIYLSSENESFKDLYCLVYGHHMDNGAMFGDITKYDEPDFFDAHKKGILITPDQIYNLEIFACVKTNAYDDMIYAIVERNRTGVPFFVNWLKQHANRYDEVSIKNNDSLLALSTCAEDSTYGRNVLFAKKTPHEGPLPKEYEEITDGRTPLAMGYVGKNTWAVLNLVCMILTIYIFMPVHKYIAKFKRKKKMKKYNETYENLAIKQSEYEPNEPISETYSEKDEEKDEEDDDGKEFPYEPKKFGKRTLVGHVTELIIAIVSVVAFILTEDMRLRMTVIDKWTLLMILILTGSWIVDVILYRYRGAVPERQNDTESVENGDLSMMG